MKLINKGSNSLYREGDRKNRFDVIILGAGLNGLCMALLCASHKLSVAIIDAQQPKLDWETTKYDIRVSAITRASENLFRKLEVWDEIQSHRISPYQRMEVWDGVGFGNISFDATDILEPNLGYIIENRVMHKALWEKAKQNDSIQFFVPSRASILHHEPHEIVLGINRELLAFDSQAGESQTGQTLRASLIIGADGARSWLRETLQIKTKTRDYGHTAIVATVTTELSHENTAWQRFLPEGPLAFLPLQHPNTCSIVWSMSPEQAKVTTQLDPKTFCQELSLAFDYRLGSVLSVEERQSFPLKMLLAEHSIENRIALIGDAYHTIHPLAGQGLNLGLLDADCLCSVLSDAHSKGQDIGQHSVLRRYERRRKGHTLMMIGLMEFFKRLFGTDKTSIIALRGLGVNLVDQSSWFKKKIIKQAMGC